MKFTPVLFAILLIALVPCAQAQQLGLSRLFYPNGTLSASYIVPTNSATTQNFGLTRTSFLGIVPIQSEVQGSFSLKKKFDLRAVHTVLIGQYSQLQPTLDEKNFPDNGYKTISLGAIRMQASVKDKLWVYGAAIGMTESNETFFTPQPFLWGGAARMRIIGLRSQIVYGSILAYNQKLRVIPVFGINQRLGKQWRATALLPFMADVNYHPTKWFSMDMLAGVNGYSGGFQIQTAEEKILRRQNYQHVKLGLSANLHLLTVFNISAEAGVAGFRQLRTFNSARENLTSTHPPFAPYVGVSVRYLTSRSNFSSKFMGKLGLGEKGVVNW
ncbi:hypothetical protein [Salmonirosea aquatica]|uniref:Type IX secretion system membrane protein PorP/SprF n=1 Tax=Salmonirosea aquatica TaxID=2654236 RepID=A0A7C9BAH4_9BACT|nr:hypothetical protein [Cytophagaceae bacterium SJW1-29]